MRYERIVFGSKNERGPREAWQKLRGARPGVIVSSTEKAAVRRREHIVVLANRPYFAQAIETIDLRIKPRLVPDAALQTTHEVAFVKEISRLGKRIDAGR